MCLNFQQYLEGMFLLDILTLSLRNTLYVTELIEELNMLCMKYQGNISSRNSSNSEANASKLLENLVEMFSALNLKFSRQTYKNSS